MLTLSKQEFFKLSVDEQEEFINRGGDICPDAAAIGQKELVGEVGPSQDSKVSPVSLTPSLSGVTSQPTSSSFAGFMIKNPVALLVLCNNDIYQEIIRLYPWQIQIMLDFADEHNDDNFPYQALLKAANGSGKDCFILAGCATWLCLRYKRALSIVTSASGQQLDNQTLKFIREICESFNRTVGLPVWDLIHRKYTCSFGEGQEGNSSYLHAFATDEPKKAEGYHPLCKGAKFGIFVSEDKTIPDEINTALDRCTGYTHRLHVSTPGNMLGHFFDLCQIAVPRSTIKNPKDVNPTDWILYHVTAYDCPDHWKLNRIKQLERDLPGGKTGAAFQSIVMAEFATTDDMIIIPPVYVWQAMQGEKYLEDHYETKWIQEEHNTGGLDLSDGVAETCLTIRNGNKHLKTIPFRFDNTEDTIKYLETSFKDNGLSHHKAIINCDCVGIGKPILDRLKRLGWSNIRYIDSRNVSSRPKTYRNVATELWFRVRRFFERHEIIFTEKDEVLRRQLVGRYYKLLDGSIHAVLTKQEQRSKGFPSPDRADAFNLAFWNYESSFEELPSELKDEDRPFQLEEEEKEETKGIFDLRCAGRKPMWVANNNQKDFRILEDAIAEYNRKVRK
jgi:hypothetical protein